ncbi:hypothetical protein MTQ94_11650 [Staphylococcus agnetis]|uniref:hypothetical protein n=1 Tax=Staphylococcus agnetis TaxID=985762 RepID=UPI00208EF3E9|nr:hypothetical protein [Staphylococcus agnetis]MCO4340794.1 hypothetical protein [Staphylococcus agnetis]MCO4344420.1 hypothetical protein [Staphylococcus agnetis]MCO4353899.1 hypothetical protein [Staphylococcus agnetis]MCO4366780.1 hypothetical protein [Staphylococcus agnetis]
MIDRLSTEEAILCNLMKHPDLYSKFKLKSEMFEDDDVKAIIGYIREVGRINANEIYFKCRDDKDFVNLRISKCGCSV